jgi:nicotinamide mononucleotide transporter
MELELVLEYTAVAFNIAYVILAARKNIWCWPMGIVGSLLSIWLFIEGKIYAESVLFIYYVLMGFYGWYEWKKKQSPSEDLPITTFSWKQHSIILLGGYAGTFGLFYILKTFTDAENPLLDSFTTIFSFITTWMVARRVLENWIYWIAINGLTIYLYLSRGFDVYATLSAVYTIMSVYGYYIWMQDYRKQAAVSS